MSFFEDASLVLIPSAQKLSKIYSVKPTDGTGDLAFTRSNDTATRVASSGLIEKVRTNLILQSQTFDNASWNKLNSATITANTSVAPDGTTTADTLSLIANASSSIAQDLSFASAATITFSVYAKVASGTKDFRLRTDNGVTTQAFTATTTWQRFSLTASVLGNTSAYVINDLAATAGDLIIWGAQAEVSDFGATPYIATTTAAVSVGPVANVPRLDYLNSSCPRLLLEPQRSNLALYSEQINNAAWSKRANIGVTANAIVSPDGTTNADKIAATDGAVVDYGCFQIVTSQLNTFSVFAKKGEMNYVFIGNNNAFASDGVFFNLNTGAISSNPSSYSATITDYGNGWYRCSVYFATNVSYFFISPSVNGTSFNFSGQSGNGIYIWGAQAELGAYATSYIPTLGASVTRGADAASKTSATALIGQTEGTLFTEFEHNGADILTAQQSLNISSGNTQNYVVLSVYDGRLNPAVKASNVNIFDTLVGPNPLSSGTHKVAIAYKSEDFAVYMDGVSVYTSSATATFATMSQVEVGNLLSYATQLGGGVSQALLFKTRLSNADLAALTA